MEHAAAEKEPLLFSAARLLLLKADPRQHAADLELAQRVIGQVQDSAAIVPFARLELANQLRALAERRYLEAGNADKDKKERLGQASREAHDAYIRAYADARIPAADRIMFFYAQVKDRPARERTQMGSEAVHALASATLKNGGASDRDRFAAAAILRYLSSNIHKIRHFAALADPLAERLLADPDLPFADRFFIVRQSQQNEKVYSDDGELPVTPAALDTFRQFEAATQDLAVPIAERAALIAHFHAMALSRREIRHSLESWQQHLERLTRLNAPDAMIEDRQESYADYERRSKTFITKEDWRQRFDALTVEAVGSALSPEDNILRHIFGRAEAETEEPKPLASPDLFALAEAAANIGTHLLDQAFAITARLMAMSMDHGTSLPDRIRAMELSNPGSAAAASLGRAAIAGHGLEGEDWWKSRVTRYPALAAAIMTSETLADVRAGLAARQKIDGEKRLFADALGITVPLLDRLQGAEDLSSAGISLVEALPMLSQLAAKDINRVPFHGKTSWPFILLVKAIPYCQAMEEFGVSPLAALMKMTDPPGIANNMEEINRRGVRITPEGLAAEIKDFTYAFQRAALLPEVMAQARAQRIRMGSIPALLEETASLPLLEAIFNKAANAPHRIHDTIAQWQRHAPHINAELVELRPGDAWPTITGEYAGKTGHARDYTVAPLRNAHEVAELARPENQDNCVAGHLKKMRAGKLHVCAVKDPHGRTVATAGFTVDYAKDGAVTAIRHYQNLAKGNEPAGEQAKAVFDEYLACLCAPEQAGLLKEYAAARTLRQHELSKAKNLPQKINSFFDFNWENEEKRQKAYDLYKPFLHGNRPETAREFLEATGVQKEVDGLIAKYKRLQSHAGRAEGLS